MSYGYDAAGRRTSVTYPGGSDQVVYAYDAANRLTTVTDWDSNVTTYTYDDADRMTLVELPNGVESAYTYDDADRLTDIEHVLGMDTLAFVNYTLDAVGNRTERVDGQGTHSYTYDDVYRLVEVTYPGPSTTSYVFDDFGNRTSMTVGMDTTTYAYDDADRLTSVGPPGASPVAYTWDDNGNLTDRGADEFEWDYEDRLVEATVDSVTTTFEYRGDGLRDSRTVGMTTTTFTWDIAAGIPVVLDDDTSRYVYGPSGLVAQKTSTDDFYYLADGLGSTMAITDDIGDVVRDYEYDVYGQVTGGSGATPNEFDFAGQQSDDSTGLQYLRARYYDPETGIFLSRDPLASLPTWTYSAHGYANSSPILQADPLGLCSFPAVLCWEPIDPSVLGISIGNPDGFMEVLTVGKYPLPVYRACIRQPDGGKTCYPPMTADAWAKLKDTLPQVALGLDAALKIAEYVRQWNRTPWGQQGRPFQNDGRNGSQKLPDVDANGNKITYTEWDAVQPTSADRSAERIVTGSDGSSWYTGNHYQTFTKLQ